MKKHYLIFVLVIISMILMNCENSEMLSSKKSSAPYDGPKVQLSEEDAEILTTDLALSKSVKDDNICRVSNEIRLKYFAMALALSLNDENVCQVIKDKCNEKFDGDYEFLWAMVKDLVVSNEKDFREIIEEKFSDCELLDISNIEDVPLLNIAVPVNIDKWDGKEPIKVGYFPITQEDTELEVINVFDNKLNTYELDAKNDPEFPVIIIGINERVDINTNEVKNDGIQLNKTTSTNVIKVKHFRLMDDKETWAGGDPEIYIKIQKYYGGTKTRTNFTKVNKEKTYLDENYSWLPKEIYSYPLSEVTQYIIKVWEDDTSNDDLVEDEWHKGSPSATKIYKYTPSGIGDWFYGDHENADLYIFTVTE